MKKNISIIANFCRPFDGRVDGRFLYLAEMLSGDGNKVELITSDFMHGRARYKDAPASQMYKSKLTYVHEPAYYHNVSLKRLFSHFVWGKNVSKYLNSLEKPDCVYCAVPSLTAAFLTSKYCKKHKIPFIIDVQDLWPEAFALAIKSRFLQRILFAPMFWVADSIYNSADLVLAVSETYKERALEKNKKCRDSLCVYLGNNGAVFDEAKEKYRVSRQDNEIWLCYIGTLGYSYDIPCVIDALKLLENNKELKKKVRFILIGDGPLRVRFEKYAGEQKVNAEFVGRKPYEEMVGLLCSCDIAINPIVKNSAASIINKVGDYALSGLPVINTQECQEYRDLLDEYKCGINCRVGDSEQVASAVQYLVNNEGVRKEMGVASRRLGEERFDRRKTYRKIVASISAGIN